MTVRSELMFIRDIAQNLTRDIDQMEAGFSKSQRTTRTGRSMDEIRARAKCLVQCAEDALSAHEQEPSA